MINELNDQVRPTLLSMNSKNLLSLIMCHLEIKVIIYNISNVVCNIETTILALSSDAVQLSFGMLVVLLEPCTVKRHPFVKIAFPAKEFVSYFISFVTLFFVDSKSYMSHGDHFLLELSCFKASYS